MKTIMYGVTKDDDSANVACHSPNCTRCNSPATYPLTSSVSSVATSVVSSSRDSFLHFSSFSSLAFNMSSTSITATQQMMASCSGALLTSVLVTPFDVIKIRIQSAAANAATTNHQCPKCMVYFNGLMDHVCVESCKPFFPRPSYKLNGNSSSFWKSFFQIVRHEGPFVLWSGLPPTLLMAIPSTVIYFTAYDNLKALWGFNELNATSSSSISSSFPSWRNLAIPFVSGAFARFASVTVISPLELVRTKMQSASLSYDQIGGAVKDALSRGGWRSLWSGWTPTILRDVPFSGFYFCGYEVAKSYYGEIFKESGRLPSSSSAFSSTSSSPSASSTSSFTSSTVKIHFLSGATSAFFATLLTQPFDVLKTRAQIRLGEANFVVNGAASESVFNSAKRVVEIHGVSGLYAGVVPRLMKVIPACAIMITSYEYFKEVFSARNARRAKDEAL